MEVPITLETTASRTCRLVASLSSASLGRSVIGVLPDRPRRSFAQHACNAVTPAPDVIIITKSLELQAAARSAPSARSRARNHLPERIMPPPQRPVLRLKNRRDGPGS